MKSKSRDFIDDPDYKSPFPVRTCCYMCGIAQMQCTHIAKTASTIAIALLFSACLSSLVKAAVSSQLTDETEYEHVSHWVGLLIASVAVLGAIPCVVFRYVGVPSSLSSSSSSWSLLVARLLNGICEREFEYCVETMRVCQLFCVLCCQP